MKKKHFLLGIAMAASVLTASDDMVDHSFGHSAAEKILVPALHISFDGKVNVNINKYNLKCKKNTLSDFVQSPESKHKAVIIDNEHFMQFTSEVPFIKKKGTVVFKCRPLNWNGRSNGATVFASFGGTSAKGNEGALSIYADSRKPKNLFVSASRKNGFAEARVSKVGAVYPITQWKNSFYHVAYAFDRDRLTLYVDGKKVSSVAADIYRIPAALDNLTVGGYIPPWCGKNEGCKTALEEFSVYDRALTAEEVVALCDTAEKKSRGRLKSISLLEIPMRNDFTSEKAINPDDEIWQKTNLYCGFFDNANRSFAARQTDIAMFYDTKGMHFLLNTPSSAKEDDFILLLQTPDAPVQRFASDSTDNGAKIQKISRNGRNFVQFFIPFSALKISLPKVGTHFRWNIIRRNGSESVSLIPFWDPDIAWDELELGNLRFASAEAPVVRMNNIKGIDGSTKFSIDVNFRAGEGSGQLFVFADTFRNGVMNRMAKSEQCYEDKLNSWTLHADNPGAGSLKAFDKVGFQMVNRKFNKMYYRSEFFPYKNPPPFTAPKISLQKKTGTLSAVTDCSGMPPVLIRNGRVVFSLFVDGKKVSEYAADSILPEIEAKFPLNKLSAGKKYSVDIELFDKNGKKLHVDRTEALFPDISVWLNNKLGYSEKVPAPFEAVRVDNGKFYCWNRCYDFTKSSLFPSQITSAGRDLLAEPISFRLVSNGKTLEFKVRKWEIVSEKATGIKYRAAASADGVELELDGNFEYDGMCFFDIALKNGKKLNVEKLDVVFPFKKEHAELFAFTESVGAGQGSKHYYGRTPEKKTFYPFEPFFWFGDKDRGMLIFSESARNWYRETPDKAVSVEKTANDVRLTYHIIGRKTVVEGERRFSFGVQAGPVRPRPLKWREFENRYCFVSTNMNYFGYIPEATELALKTIDKAKKSNKLTSAYTFFNNVSTSLPEYNLFFDDWKRNEGQKKGEFYLDTVAPNIKSWQDFVVYSYVLGLKKYGFHGVYYDLGWPTPSKNIRHGGFINEFGKPENKWPILAIRSIAKRAYTEYRKHHKETMFVGHVSSNPIVLPVVSFCDILLDGEQYGGILKSYTEQIPEDRGLCEFTARQFGPPLLFLPELAKSGNANYSHKTPEPTVEMLAICYLYDMLVWPLFCNSGAFIKYRTPYTKFITGSEIEFLPYWEKNHGIKASDPDIKISAYRKKGSLLAAVVNLTGKNVDTQVVIRGKYSSVKDAVSGEKISLDNINVPAKSLRLLLLNE